MRIGLVILLYLFSFSSSAGFSTSKCRDLKSNEDFSVQATIGGNEPRESILAGKKNDKGRFETLWTNSNNEYFSIIYDRKTVDKPEQSPENKYQIMLTYDANHPSVGNKSGLLTYYLKEGGAWVEQTWEFANLSSIHAAAIKISSDNASDLKCDDEIDVPEPPEPENKSQFEFGVAQCSNMTGSSICTISFKKTYSSSPLVFVMPTIDNTSPDSDRPATLRLSSVSKSQAQFKQVFSNPNSLAKNGMVNVSYFVMERGTTTIDGNVVQAGYTWVNKIVGKHYDNDKDKRWKKVEFQHEYDEITPVVLTEIQTHTNGLSEWLTTAIRDVDDEEFDLALERTHLRPYFHDVYEPEKVAYLAAPAFTATYEGRKISFGRNISTKRTTSSNKQPMKTECLEQHDLGFPLEGVVANKQQRSGNDGGWLRRCKLSDQKVSLVVDENASQRAHASEKVGYFAFGHELPLPKLDICPYVPEVVQTNAYDNGRQNLLGVLAMSGANNKISLARDNTKLSVLAYMGGNNGCEYPSSGFATCNIDKTKFYDSLPVLLDSNFTSNQDLTCKKGKICRLEQNAKRKDVELKEDSVLILAGGEYWFKELKFAEENTEIRIEGPTKIHYQKIMFEKPGVKVNTTGMSEELLIIGHGKDAGFHLEPDKGDHVNINGYIYVDPWWDSHSKHSETAGNVTISGDNNTILGGVSAHSISISGTGNTIKGRTEHNCSGDTENYTLELSPLKQFFLLCENPLATFRVLTDSDVAESYPGEIEITLPAELSVKEVVVGHYVSGNKYRPSNGVLQLRLKASKIGEFSMQGQLSTDASQSQTGSYYIAPYKFDIPTVGAIAGKSTEFDINVLACKNDQETLVTDYSGERTLTYTASTLTKPAGGVNPNLEISAGENTPNLNKQVKLNFSSGKASAYMKFNEAGAIWSQISDLSFKCPTGFDCDIEGGESWSGLKGTLNVELRPWTFAICESDSHAMNGTATSGNKYIAAGEEFDIQLKPVIWSKDLNEEQQKAKYSDFCSLAITQNFFDENAWSSKVGLEAELPTGFVGTFSGADTEKLNTEGKAKQHISFAEVSFSDVGHFTLKAKGTGYESVQGGIDTGKREIGRFYPKHIIVKSNSWEYVSKHDDFAYLDQPIAIGFIAEAQNSDNEATLNYSKLASEYKATLLPFAANGEGSSDWNSRMLAPWEVQSWVNAELEVDEQSFTLLKLVEKASPKTTRIDGPFDGSNLMTGIKIKSGLPDPTVMKKQDSSVHKGDKFPTPLKARYGRVIIEDLGGSVGQTLTIPLRTEFWNGNEFVTNTDDSGTEFDGAGYCSLGIWPNTSSTARLSGGGDVVNGSSSKLVASQGTAGREQVRLWLRTASQTPSEVPGVNCKGFNKSQPWLNFNWRGKGDEIPSTVVTFGSFRGNDRVIFRGESRMTGQ